MNDKSWILFITIPLFMICLVLCVTFLYLNSHPYPFKVEMSATMDDNFLEAFKLAYSETYDLENASSNQSFYIDTLKTS